MCPLIRLFCERLEDRCVPSSTNALGISNAGLDPAELFTAYDQKTRPRRISATEPSSTAADVAAFCRGIQRIG
jgi:hypothetical protein